MSNKLREWVKRIERNVRKKAEETRRIEWEDRRKRG
jgi:hypothetical protein